MHVNRHSELEGRHAFLSASKYHWINYDEEKLIRTFTTAMAAAKGTQLHEFAAEAVRLGIKLEDNSKTLNAYVNDAIGFRMTPEQMLYYSPNAFGTADAISFRKVDGEMVLRIHDLKTGVNAASFKQLLVYAAFFCLEYGFKPAQLKIIMRIYQNDEVLEEIAEVHDVTSIMDRIITFDRLLDDIKAKELG